MLTGWYSFCDFTYREPVANWTKVISEEKATNERERRVAATREKYCLGV
jgi:hypothetical protein